MKPMLLAAALFGALALTASAQPTQRETLPESVRAVRYEVNVTPDAAALTLAGDVRIEIDVAAPTREIVLNSMELEFDAVTLDNRAHPQVRFDTEAQTAHLAFAQPVSAGRHTLAITYRGKIYRQSQGLFAVDYDAGGREERVLATQFQAADARRFVPSFDEPGQKAVWQLSVVVPQNRTAVSNVPAAGTDNLANGMKRVRFQPTPAMSSYLLFLAIGDLERITTTVEGTEIGIVAVRGKAEQGRFALESAAQLLTYYNDYFGEPYPLPKLDMIAIPGGGNFGAMENWGAILYFEEYLLLDPALASEVDRQNVFVFVAHEMAHMWFGDLVTMEWWDDLWLNEGFASWMERKATQHFHPDWNTWMEGQRRLQEAMDLDARASTHPVVQEILTVDQANEAFDRITYEKGRAIIRMLEAHVGEEQFRNGVRAFIAQHKFGNARTADLWAAIEAASDQPMRQIAQDLTDQPGVPLIRVALARCEDRARHAVLTQSRFGYDEPSRAGTQRWRIPVSVRMFGAQGDSGAVLDESGNVRLPVSDCGRFVVNPDGVGYYRVLYPRNLFGQLSRGFAQLQPADQLNMLYDTRAFGLSGDAPYSDLFQLAQNTPLRADPLVWDFIAAEIAETYYLYDTSPERDEYRDWAIHVLNPLWRRVGWSARRNEAANVGVLRGRLISTLSILGDPDLALGARSRFNGEIPGAIREQTLYAIGRGANTQTFDELLARARAATDSREKVYYYQALSFATDPALAQRALGLAFDANMDASLGVDMITVVSRAHPRLAWDFARAHPDELAARLDPLNAAQYPPSVTARANDPAMLTELRTYIDTRVPADVRRNPESHYLRLNERLSARETRLEQLNDWLERRP